MSELPPFQSLVDEHGAVVLRLLVALVGRQEAGDCWQETFVAALAAYPRLRRADNLRGWLTTIAYRKAMDHHRRAGRRALPSAALPEIAVTDRSALDGEGLWAAVAELPEKQRLAVTHRYAGDLSYAEIGARLGCSEAAARRSAFEGISRLRREGWS